MSETGAHINVWSGNEKGPSELRPADPFWGDSLARMDRRRQAAAWRPPAEPDGFMNADVVEVGGVDEADVGGFVAGCDGAADDAAEVGHVELLPDFVVGVGDDVVWVGADAQ